MASQHNTHSDSAHLSVAAVHALQTYPLIRGQKRWVDYILQQLDAQRSIFSALGESDHAAQLGALSARLNDRILAFGTAAATRDVTPALYGGLSGAFDAIAMAVADIRDALPEDKKALIPDMGTLDSRRDAMLTAVEKAMAAPPGASGHRNYDVPQRNR